jgi:hypothetical protein
MIRSATTVRLSQDYFPSLPARSVAGTSFQQLFNMYDLADGKKKEGKVLPGPD